MLITSYSPLITISTHITYQHWVGSRFNNSSYLFFFAACFCTFRPPHGCLQTRTVNSKVTCGIHLVLQDLKLCSVYPWPLKMRKPPILFHPETFWSSKPVSDGLKRNIFVIYSNLFLTVFFNLDTHVIFIPAMIAIKELKLPMLMHSFATSTKYSMIRTRFFFFKCCKHKQRIFKKPSINL